MGCCVCQLQRGRGFNFDAQGALEGEKITPASIQKMVDSSGCCMDVQYFTAGRLGEIGRQNRMESVAELEEFIGTLDLTPEEESRIARILENLREEIAVSG